MIFRKWKLIIKHFFTTVHNINSKQLFFALQPHVLTFYHASHIVEISPKHNGIMKENGISKNWTYNLLMKSEKLSWNDWTKEKPTAKMTISVVFIILVGRIQMFCDGNISTKLNIGRYSCDKNIKINRRLKTYGLVLLVLRP